MTIGDVLKPYGKVDQRRLDAFVNSYGSNLPNNFLKWIELVNGGVPKKTCVSIPNFGLVRIHHVYGIHKGPSYLQLDEANEILVDNLNPSLIAFADDEGGNQFAISIRKINFGSVVFWDHEVGNEYPLAENIFDFGDLLVDKNEEGVNDLEKVLRSDDAGILEQLLAGKDIDYKNELGRTPLEEGCNIWKV